MSGKEGKEDGKERKGHKSKSLFSALLRRVRLSSTPETHRGSEQLLPHLGSLAQVIPQIKGIKR